MDGEGGKISKNVRKLIQKKKREKKKGLSSAMAQEDKDKHLRDKAN